MADDATATLAMHLEPASDGGGQSGGGDMGRRADEEPAPRQNQSSMKGASGSGHQRRLKSILKRLDRAGDPIGARVFEANGQLAGACKPNQSSETDATRGARATGGQTSDQQHNRAGAPDSAPSGRQLAATADRDHWWAHCQHGDYDDEGAGGAEGDIVAIGTAPNGSGGTGPGPARRRSLVRFSDVVQQLVLDPIESAPSQGAGRCPDSLSLVDERGGGDQDELALFRDERH